MHQKAKHGIHVDHRQNAGAACTLSNQAHFQAVPGERTPRHNDTATRAHVAAARQCHEALSNRQELQDTSARLDRETAFALNRSAVVGLMECYEKETLHRSLLAWGVDEQDLNRIDLVARAESKAGLRHFVQGVTGEK